MPMVIERLGSSTCSGSSAMGLSGSASVSPMVMSSNPATATMSPGPALWAGIRSSASVMKSSVILACSMVPSMRHHATRWPRSRVPLMTRQSARATQVRRGVEVAHQGLEAVAVFVFGRRVRSRRSSGRAASGRPTVSLTSSEAQPWRALA